MAQPPAKRQRCVYGESVPYYNCAVTLRLDDEKFVIHEEYAMSSSRYFTELLGEPRDEKKTTFRISIGIYQP